MRLSPLAAAGAIAGPALLAIVTTCAAANHMVPVDRTESDRVEVPAWYLDTPRDDQAILVPATATSSDLQVAVDKAQTAGRILLGQQIGIEVEALTRRFVDETGHDSSQLLDQFSVTGQLVTREVLHGSRARNQVLLREGDRYRAFVLMELPMDAVRRQLVTEIRANEELYTRVRASAAFRELEQALDRIGSDSAGRRSPP